MATPFATTFIKAAKKYIDSIQWTESKIQGGGCCEPWFDINVESHIAHDLLCSTGLYQQYKDVHTLAKINAKLTEMREWCRNPFDAAVLDELIRFSDADESDRRKEYGFSE